METVKKEKHALDICGGPILKSMILYALPLIATNLLQLLFNAADVMVLSLFSENGQAATAAVSGTSSLIQLIINLFVGLSVGTNVLVARCVGSGDTQRSQKIVGCSVAISLVFGIILLFVGFFGARTFLVWMDCNEEALDMAVTYMKIYFLGMPIMMLYNFSTAVLRGVGDTVRPLIYLVIGGVVNVVLNIVFVLVFKKDVEGVAIATVTSQGIAAVLAIIALVKEEGAAKLTLKNLRLDKKELWNMMKIGLPSGIQGCLFSISNVLVQSSVNRFGIEVQSANGIASQIDNFTYQAMYGISLSSTAFVSQNYGAKRFDRVKKSVRTAFILTTATGVCLGGLIALLARPLCSVFIDSEKGIEYASLRMVIISVTYFLCGIQEVFAYSLRGLGKSLTPMFVVLGGTCLFRIVWLKTVLVKWHTLQVLYALYPASWLLTSLIFIPIYFITRNHVEKKLEAEITANNTPTGDSLAGAEEKENSQI